MKPNKIHLVKTCEACPEQYDAMYGPRQVGYLRLRWGTFTVQCPDVRGVIIYQREFEDGLLGEFLDDDTRREELANALAAIAKWHTENKS